MSCSSETIVVHLIVTVQCWVPKERRIKHLRKILQLKRKHHVIQTDKRRTHQLRQICQRYRSKRTNWPRKLRWPWERQESQGYALWRNSNMRVAVPRLVVVVWRLLYHFFSFVCESCLSVQVYMLCYSNRITQTQLWMKPNVMSQNFWGLNWLVRCTRCLECLNLKQVSIALNPRSHLKTKYIHRFQNRFYNVLLSLLQPVAQKESLSQWRRNCVWVSTVLIEMIHDYLVGSTNIFLIWMSLIIIIFCDKLFIENYITNIVPLPYR